MQKPSEAEPKVIQFLVDYHANLFILRDDGRVFERVEDRDKLGQPHGPHWRWREVEIPR